VGRKQDSSFSEEKEAKRLSPIWPGVAVDAGIGMIFYFSVFGILF
jgi:hypothetical protein